MSINRAGMNYNVPYKYKAGEGDASQPQIEYTIVLRLAELYLIRAEARAQKSDLDGAKADLLPLRNRAARRVLLQIQKVNCYRR